MSEAGRPTIPIADAHVHFWDLDRNSYPWLENTEPEGPFGKTSAIRKNFAIEDYRRETAGQNVVRLVHIEAGWTPDDPLGEMRWIQHLADTAGAPHAHMAHIDLASADAERLIDAHQAFGLFRGVRDRLLDGDFTAATAEKTRIDDPAWLRGLSILEERDLCFDLQAPPALAARAAELAANHPRLRFILTHAGYPPSPEHRSAFTSWTEGIRRLADQPNVVVKLSGLPLAAKRWDPAQARHAAALLLDVFGVERVLAASNAPVDRLFVPVGDMLAEYRRWLRELPADGQRAVLHDNTVRTYRLEASA